MSEDVEGTELHADARADRTRRLGHGVLPGALAGPAHHDQVAVAQGVADLGVATDGAQAQLARRAERDDGHHRVDGAAAPVAVAVPGHRVVAVAVVAAACRHERLAQLVAVVRGQCVAGLGEGGVGQLLADAVGVDQARHVDDGVVHRPPLRPPRHLLHQVGEDGVGALEPAGQHVDPRAPRQRGALHPPRERSHARPPGVEAGVEQRGLEVDRHTGSLRRFEHMF